MHVINITEAPAEHSLHGTDEVWCQVKTGPTDDLLDWPSVKLRIAEMRPDLALPVRPAAYYPGDEPDPENGQSVLEDWWIFPKELKVNR